MRGRRLGAAALLLGVTLLAACQTQPDDELVRPEVTTTLAPELPTLPSLPVGSGPVRPRDAVSVEGSTVTVGSRSVPLAPLRVDDYVVVRGGVFFLNGDELWFTDLSRAQPTGFTDVASLVTSPDGRVIAFIDHAHGPADAAGTPLALSAAYDARTGRLLASSYAGMGDVNTDDLAELYRQSPPRVQDVTRDAMTIRGVAGPVEVPLGR